MARIIYKEEKRCDIALSAITLFCEKGIQQTSINEIAKSAGVAKGTIYLYFKNKDNADKVERLILGDTVKESVIKSNPEIIFKLIPFLLADTNIS